MRDLLTEHHYVFRNNFSTICQLVSKVKHTTLTLEPQKYCIAKRLDIHQAFNTVWYARLDVQT